jgi:hypothetical protein
VRHRLDALIETPEQKRRDARARVGDDFGFELACLRIKQHRAIKFGFGDVDSD